MLRNLVLNPKKEKKKKEQNALQPCPFIALCNDAKPINPTGVCKAKPYNPILSKSKHIKLIKGEMLVTFRIIFFYYLSHPAM